MRVVALEVLAVVFLLWRGGELVLFRPSVFFFVHSWLLRSTLLHFLSFSCLILFRAFFLSSLVSLLFFPVPVVSLYSVSFFFPFPRPFQFFLSISFAILLSLFLLLIGQCSLRSRIDTSTRCCQDIGNCHILLELWDGWYIPSQPLRISSVTDTQSASGFVSLYLLL
jgi:hypothetical protein